MAGLMLDCGGGGGGNGASFPVVYQGQDFEQRYVERVEREVQTRAFFLLSAKSLAVEVTSGRSQKLP